MFQISEENSNSFFITHLSGEKFFEFSQIVDIVHQSTGLVFIESLKYLNELKDHNRLNECYLIIDKDLFDLSYEDHRNFFGKLKSIYSTNQFNKTFTLFSKYIFDKREDIEIGESNISKNSHIAQSAIIGKGVTIEDDVTIYDQVVIGDGCHIKKGSIIFSHVSLYSRVHIGENVRIHSHSTLGSDGFGYRFINNRHDKVWQSGGVIIEKDVEIGSNTSVDCGTFNPTFIGEGSKIDNFVQIAHNVKIGKHCIVCGMSGFGGSSRIGDYTVMGGRSGVGPGVVLGKGCKVAGGTLVNRSFEAGAKLGGYPATYLKDWKRSIIKFQKSARS